MVDAASITTVNIGLQSNGLAPLPDVERPSRATLAKPFPTSTAGSVGICHETCDHKESTEKTSDLMTDARPNTHTNVS